MNAVLWLLAVQGALGTFDTLYFHEWRARLPARDEMRSELRLHALRSVIYGAVFCSLPWMAWTGAAAVALALLLAVEAVVTFADFVVEDRVRANLGGVYAGERVMHGLMAIVYGAFMTTFLPVLYGWYEGDVAPLGEGMPAALLVALTALGVGCLLSAVRDGLAATGYPLAAWPWGVAVESSPPPRQARRRSGLAFTLGSVLLLMLLVRRSR
jgi:hypothetical protein